MTAENLGRGDEWFASVTYFGPVTSETKVEYELEVIYLLAKSANLPLWSVIGILGLGLFVFALFRFFKVLRKPRLGSS